LPLLGSPAGSQTVSLGALDLSPRRDEAPPPADLRHNAQMVAGSSVVRGISPSASPEEAAAIAAALEAFMRATAPAAADPGQPLDPWQRAAILEGVRDGVGEDARNPWPATPG
jgi:hypothetical protein